MADAAPPYPPDTRAKGWRLELDYEQIDQSDTWALAGPEARPWLLMMWLVAWKQTPVGTLPSNEAVIAAQIGAAPKVWARHRDVLMRGWALASDGRRYHQTMTARVFEMMAKRRSDSDRKARERQRTAAESGGNPPVVTPESRVTPTGLHRESDTRTSTSNTSKTTSSRRARATRRCPADFAPSPQSRHSLGLECPGVDLDRELAKFRDWEFSKAHSDWPATFSNWVRRAFELRQPYRNGSHLSPEPAWRTEQRERMQGFAGYAAAKPSTTIDMEPEDAPQRLVG